MGINFIDLSVIVVFAYFVWQGFLTGLVGGLLNLTTTVISFMLAGIFYPVLGNFPSRWFNIGENFSFVLSFFLILIVSEVVLSFLVSLIYKSLITPLHRRFHRLAQLDRVLGVFPAALVGGILISLFLLLFLILPINPLLRAATEKSWWGRHVLVKALDFEPKFERYLNRLPYKSLIYLLTPSPESGESIKLSFPKYLNLKEDVDSEKTMLVLVNQERAKIGTIELKADNKLIKVGLSHCLDMFKRNYFSHYTPEGKSPFDRMREADITYTFAGENLAYAPSVEIAHEGLINSKGHRENILRPEFGHLGVGVIDGGLSGKMFCQEFSN